MNRLLISVIGFLSLSVVAVAMAIYAMVARPQAAGVTLSIVGGERVFDEDANVSCVISNGTSNAISFFKVYDDGFGCTLEWQEGGNWTTSGVTWCATGRDIVKLNAAETYSFRAKVPLDHYKQRLLVEIGRAHV